MRYKFLSFLVNQIIRAINFIGYWSGKLLLFLDWGSGKHPQFFNHRIDYALWPYDPNKWAITARGTLTRARMFPDCTVLELCCGDGSNAYLYYTDIALKVVGVDGDSSAINFAKRNYRSNNLHFYKLDIISMDFDYSFGKFDFVIMNAALSYFTLNEIDIILKKIKSIAYSNFKFMGMVPKKNGHIDHKNEFMDENDLVKLLSYYFLNVEISLIYEANGIHYYFCCSDWL